MAVSIYSFQIIIKVHNFQLKVWKDLVLNMSQFIMKRIRLEMCHQILKNFNTVVTA